MNDDRVERFDALAMSLVFRCESFGLSDHAAFVKTPPVVSIPRVRGVS
jgi:hypothetical protein